MPVETSELCVQTTALIDNEAIIAINVNTTRCSGLARIIVNNGIIAPIINEQKELAEFVKRLDEKGAKVVVSNSDPKNVDSKDDFFDNIYSYLKIARVTANRMINSKAKARGKINELLITNC